MCVCVCVCVCVCPSFCSLSPSYLHFTGILFPIHCVSCRWCLLVRLSVHPPYAPTPPKERTICRPYFRFPQPVSEPTTRPPISVRFRLDSLHRRALDFLQFSTASALLQSPFSIAANPDHPVRWAHTSLHTVPVSRVRTSPANRNVRRSMLLGRL